MLDEDYLWAYALINSKFYSCFNFMNYFYTTYLKNKTMKYIMEFIKIPLKKCFKFLKLNYW